MYASHRILQLGRMWSYILTFLWHFCFFKWDLNNIVILCVENLSFWQQSPIQASLCQPYNISWTPFAFISSWLWTISRMIPSINSNIVQFFQTSMKKNPTTSQLSEQRVSLWIQKHDRIHHEQVFWVPLHSFKSMEKTQYCLAHEESCRRPQEGHDPTRIVCMFQHKLSETDCMWVAHCPAQCPLIGRFSLFSPHRRGSCWGHLTDAREKQHDLFGSGPVVVWGDISSEACTRCPSLCGWSPWLII